MAEVSGCIKMQWENAVYAMKYQNRRIYGQTFGKEMAEHFLPYLWERKITLIVPVPLHSRRKRKRGFNQAEIVAKVLSENTGIAMDAGAVKRIKATSPQKELGDKGRKRNIRGAFAVQKNVKGENIVLIDDIYTTGSTLDEAARVLKKAGAENVYFLIGKYWTRNLIFVILKVMHIRIKRMR